MPTEPPAVPPQSRPARAASFRPGTAATVDRDRADGSPDKDLFSSGNRTRQQKVRDVQTCEQEKKPRRTKNQNQAGAEISRKPTLVSAYKHAVVFGNELLEQDVHLRLSLGDADL